MSLIEFRLHYIELKTINIETSFCEEILFYKTTRIVTYVRRTLRLFTTYCRSLMK